MKNYEGEYWFTLRQGDPMVGISGHYRFRCGPIPCTSVSAAAYYRRYYRNYRMVGYLRARADRETGKYVRIGHMEEFRGVHDENRRHTDRSWKSYGKKKHQWM